MSIAGFLLSWYQGPPTSSVDETESLYSLESNDSFYSCYSDDLEPRVASLFVRKMGEKKKEQAESKKQAWFERYDPIMIGGDVLTAGYALFQGITALSPALQSAALVSSLSLFCGELGGAINIWVALKELKEAYQAFKNDNTLNKWRLLLDALGLMLIGTIMMMVSLASRVAALGTIGALFATNPWILPLLFFLISLPLIVEVGYRVISHTGTAAKLHLGQIREALESDQKICLKGSVWEPLYHLTQEGNSPQIPLLCHQLIEKMQDQIGVEAALSSLALFTAILEGESREKILSQLERAQADIDAWQQAQYVRLAQQVLYTLAFLLSMGAVGSLGSRLLTAGSDLLISFANLVALYMDILWPFKRNVPMIVASVDPAMREQLWQQATG